MKFSDYYKGLNEGKTQYDIGMGSMGNGTTIWNRKEQEHGDYKIIAHVGESGEISYHDKNLPNDIKKKIQDVADKSKEKYLAHHKQQAEYLAQNRKMGLTK